MSAIASFLKLPKASLSELQKAAIPKKGFFGKPKDTFDQFLRDHARPVADYRWSGYVLATLLPYLDEKHQIDIDRSEHDELAKFLFSARGDSYSFLTETQRAKYLSRLEPSLFSKDELRDYYNEFNETSEGDEIGTAMLDGISAIHSALTQVDSDSVVLLSIG